MIIPRGRSVRHPVVHTAAPICAVTTGFPVNNGVPPRVPGVGTGPPAPGTGTRVPGAEVADRGLAHLRSIQENPLDQGVSR